jgi:hypothetical protein
MPDIDTMNDEDFANAIDKAMKTTDPRVRNPNAEELAWAKSETTGYAGMDKQLITEGALAHSRGSDCTPPEHYTRAAAAIWREGYNTAAGKKIRAKRTRPAVRVARAEKIAATLADTSGGNGVQGSVAHRRGTAGQAEARP